MRLIPNMIECLGMRKYGKDFQAIAEVIGTKTEVHMRSFFVNYRRRFNLDAVLQEYEAEHGPIQDNEEKVSEKLKMMRNWIFPSRGKHSFLLNFQDIWGEIYFVSKYNLYKIFCCYECTQ